jgi:hypothetical protein
MIPQDSFARFSDLLRDFDAFLSVPQRPVEAFAVEEFRRFYSIAGTILTNFRNVRDSINERIFTHILIRPLLENYFWLLYIFDGNQRTMWDTRFDEYMAGFKRDYYKLYNEKLLPNKDQLEPPDLSWQALKKPKDVNSLLAAVKNIFNDNLSYLYFVYRIMSFDTHGKTLKLLFSTAFGKDCQFAFVKIAETIQLIADSYLVISHQIGSKDSTPTT